MRSTRKTKEYNPQPPPLTVTTDQYKDRIYRSNPLKSECADPIHVFSGSNEYIRAMKYMMHAHKWHQNTAAEKFLISV
jgi:hypothetical protein